MAGVGPAFARTLNQQVWRLNKDPESLNMFFCLFVLFFVLHQMTRQRKILTNFRVQ